MEIKQSSTHVTYVMLKDSIDNLEKTGIINPSVYYSKNGGASIQLASPTWVEVDATNIKGVYKLAFTTAMTDTVGELIVSVNATGCLQWVGKYVVVANVEADTKQAIDALNTRASEARLAKLDGDLTVQSDLSGLSTLTLANIEGSSVLAKQTTLNTVASDVVLIKGYTDTLETNMTTLAADISQIKTYVDSVETYLNDIQVDIGNPSASSTTLLAQIQLVKDYVDTLEANITNVITDLSTIKTYTDGVEGSLVNLHTKVDNLSIGGGGTVDIPALVDAIWDEVITGHVTANTFGEIMNLLKALRLAYTDARALKLDNLNAAVGNIPTNPLLSNDTRLGNLDAPVSTRLSSADYVPSEINLTTEQVDQLAGAILDSPIDIHNLAGTVGQKINSAAAAGDPLLNVVPGNYATGTAGHIIGSIASNVIEFVSPISQDGRLLMLNRGNDYYTIDGKALAWVDTKNAWPDLAGSAVNFVCGNLNVVATIITPSGLSKTILVELSKEQVNSLSSKYFEINATLSNGHIVTLAEGMVIVE